MPESTVESPVKRETKTRESPKERQYRRGKGKKSRRPPAPRTHKYTGDEEVLKGHVFDIGYNQSDQYTTTIREISQHVAKTYKNGSDVKKSIDTMEHLTLDMPTDPVYPDPIDPSPVIKHLWNRSVDAYARRVELLEQNMKTLFSLVWGQCSMPLKAKIESDVDFTEVEEDMDSIALLVIIRSINFAMNAEKNPYQALHEAKRRFYSFKQERTVTCSAYLEKFQNMLQVIETVGGVIGKEPGLIELELEDMRPPVLPKENARPEQKALAILRARDKYLAMMFLMNSDRNRYGKLIEELGNEYLKGNLQAFPTDLIDMYRIMINWKCDPKQRRIFLQ